MYIVRGLIAPSMLMGYLLCHPKVSEAVQEALSGLVSRFEELVSNNLSRCRQIALSAHCSRFAAALRDG